MNCLRKIDYLNLSTVNKTYLVIILCSCYQAAFGQFLVDSLSEFKVSGYVDAYYAYDSRTEELGVRPYSTQAVAHNQFDINLAILKVAYSDSLFRAEVGLQAGTFPLLNQGAEPEYLRYIYSAYAGIKLAKDLWLDVGLMPSYLGIEPAIPMDNWNYTRLLVSDILPYFQTGAQLSYSPRKHWKFSFLVLNGWNIIRENNSQKSIGSQVQYNKENLLISYSNYIGRDDGATPILAQSDGSIIGLQAFHLHRFFNELFISQKISKVFDLAISLDFSFDGYFPTTTNFGAKGDETTRETLFWSASAFVLKASLRNVPVYFSGGLEWYFENQSFYLVDLRGDPSVNRDQNLFNVIGGVHYCPSPRVKLHLEGRFYRSNEELFGQFREIGDAYTTSAVAVFGVSADF